MGQMSEERFKEWAASRKDAGQRPTATKEETPAPTVIELTSKRIKLHLLLSAILFVLSFPPAFIIEVADVDTRWGPVSGIIASLAMGWYIVTRIVQWWRHS